MQLNDSDPMVDIMLTEQNKTKGEMYAFSRYVIKSGVANIIAISLSYIIMGAYIRAGIHFFSTFFIFYHILVDSLSKVNTKKIEEMALKFQEHRVYPNHEEVYNETLKLCEMKGFLRGRAVVVWVINIISLIGIISESIIILTKFFL